ncbi:MAG: murein L,D-transpeptidase catalytic domain family protein [bacterium]|nr:murein L,D-transpeptidase catalytic domain family protein [bacterium]
MKHHSYIVPYILIIFLAASFWGCGESFNFTPYKHANKSKIKILQDITSHENLSDKYALLLDMSLPSNKKRLFLVDLAPGKVIYKTHVSHGVGSGRGAYAVKFSNRKGSKCSSLGIYMIRNSYSGKHGTSFRLLGLEPSNSNALKRSIVMHSADYVTTTIAAKTRRVGNSFGCPAVSKHALAKLGPYLVPRTILWIYN